MRIEEIIKRGFRSREATNTLTDLVEGVLLAIKAPIGTTKLIDALLPEAPDADFKKLTSLLWTVRQRPDTKDFWAYTGKKTSFGTLAIHWLPLKEARETWEAPPVLDDHEEYLRGKAEYEAHMAKLKKERETQ